MTYDKIVNALLGVSIVLGAAGIMFSPPVGTILIGAGIVVALSSLVVLFCNVP